MQIINKNDPQLISKALTSLQNGGLIIYPTETCYGVGVDATNQAAVEKLLNYKRRPEGKAISIAVANQKMAERYVNLNKTALDIYRKFLPGPITVISESRHIVSKELEAENGTLGIRYPDFAITLELIKAFGKPITATSANQSGKKTPYSIDDVLQNISQKQKKLIDLIIDFGNLAHNPPSTVIDTTKQAMQVLRQGSVNFGKHRYELEIASPEQMIEEGSKLILKYKNLLAENCLLVMFNADLGAGKTQFSKGIAKALEIKEIVSSPTYSIINEYDFATNFANGKLIHMDAWRLESIDELKKLQLEDYFAPGNVIVVEWSGTAESYFTQLASSEKVLTVGIEIEYKDLNKRNLVIFD